MTATRRFTNIHAAQCNVLRQLKASRFRVALYLFDDSRRTKDPASEDLSRACDHFTQVAEKGLGTKFDMVRRTSRLWPGTWWRFVRYWRLFRCLVNVLSVLTVQDFREFAEKGNTTQDGASHWQMWHFIEPALTLSFLLHFRDTRKTAVLTLSGSDEKDMWLRLMGCSVAAHRAVFHLFIPQLTQPAGTAAPRRVAMDLDTPFVAWDNEDDIRRALQRYELPPVSGDTGNLFDWIIRHFVCVPHLADPECRLGPWTFDPLRPERLWELATLAGKEQVINHIVDDLSSRLLGGR